MYITPPGMISHHPSLYQARKGEGRKSTF